MKCNSCGKTAREYVTITSQKKTIRPVRPVTTEHYFCDEHTLRAVRVARRKNWTITVEEL